MSVASRCSGLLALGFALACGDGSATHVQLEGSIQKGPFVAGGDITVQGLDAHLALTGTGYFTQTRNDAGQFAIEVPLSEPYLEVRTTGYYFNEVSGHLSAGPISLRAITPVHASGPSTLQVNVLTHLSRDRIATLVRGGLDFDPARAQAEAEVLRAFGVAAEATGGLPFTALDMQGSGPGAAVLIAVSAMIQGNNDEAQLTEFLAQLSSDLADDGQVGQPLADRITSQTSSLDPAAIRSNLQARYGALGHDVEVADPGPVIDRRRPIEPPSWRWSDNRYEACGHASRLTIELTPVTPGTVVSYRTDDALSSPGPWLTGGAWVRYTGPIILTPARGARIALTARAESRYDPSLKSAEEPLSLSSTVETTPAPMFTPAAGTYAAPLSVTLSVPFSDLFPDAVIHFTTDGTTPTRASAVYSGPITFPEGQDVTLKAVAVAPGAGDSAEVTSWYRAEPGYAELSWPPFVSVADAHAKLVGRWIGRMTSPWIAMNGTIDFAADGTFTSTSLSPGLLDGVCPAWEPFMYYGGAGTSTWSIDDLTAAGMGIGVLVLDGNDGFRMLMSSAQVSATGDNLRFELYLRGEYGPFQYDLTRLR